MRTARTQRSAVDAFRKGLRHAPAVVNRPESWGGVTVCHWKLPYLDGFALSENDEFVVAYHSEGSRKVRAACGGPWSETTSTPGLISVIPPDRRVDYTVEGEVGFSSIHIPRQLVENLAESCFPVTPQFRFAFSDAFASACVDVLMAEARRDGACNFPYVHATARALLLHLMQAFRANGDDAPPAPGDDSCRRLDAMLDFIDARLNDPLSVDALAARAHVSRAHFNRRFRNVTGLSPHRYITLRRIEKAKVLLREPARSLAEVALDVGFCNQSHFTQVFHAFTGQTPTQFRKSTTV